MVDDGADGALRYQPEDRLQVGRAVGDAEGSRRCWISRGGRRRSPPRPSGRWWSARGDPSTSSTWGAKKLLVRGAPPGSVGGLAESIDVCDLLRREGLIVPRPRRPRVPHGGHALSPITAPNDTWTTDFKGEFRTGDRRYCYPLTLRDGFSRYVLRCDALLSRSYALTRRGFERSFAEFGLPLRIRSDNGGPVCGPRPGALVAPQCVVDAAGDHPRTDRTGPAGAERLARTIPSGAQSGDHAPAGRDGSRPAAAASARFVASITRCGRMRACRISRPRATITRRARRLPARLPPLVYPGHVEVRLVSSAGCISWRGTPIFLTEVLNGEQSASRKSPTESGHCRSPRSAWGGLMNEPDDHRAAAAGRRVVTAGRGSCRTCGRTESRPQLLGKRTARVSHSSHRPSINCYPCLRTNL